MTEKSFIRADEVAEELDVSKSYAYKVIKQLNDELSAKGYITVAGRISRQYFNENNATLDIVGRDQPDMKIKLVRDTKRLVWNFEEAETELWEEPPDPLLEKISEFVSSGGNCWNGTASELCEKLGSDMKPNATHPLRRHTINCLMRLCQNSTPSRNAKTAASKTTTKKSVMESRKSLFMK